MDETTRGGTLRRLPDPPSLVRAREAAKRRAQGEPEASPAAPSPAGTAGAADEERAGTDEDHGEAAEKDASSPSSGGSGTHRVSPLSDFVTSAPRAPTEASAPSAPSTAPGGPTSATGGHRGDVDEPTTVLPVITGDPPPAPGPPAPVPSAPTPSGPHRAGAGQPTAPPPYSGGPYAPNHAHPQAAPPYQQRPAQQQPQAPARSQPAPQPHPHPRSVPYRDVPTRVSVPVVGPELAGAEGRVRHGDTLARRTGRYLKRMLASSDTTAVTAAVQAVQQPLSSGRQIAVTSIRGGSGKSTVAALLALTFAHHRTDPVIAVEADPALGTLPRRLGATEVRWSCADLARILDPSMQITDLIGYLLPYPGGGWLLPGSQGTVGTQLDLETYRIVMTAMRRYFAATVVDCQTLPAEVARTALTTTQARVLVAPATVEGVAATRTVLEWLGKLHRSMLPTTVVALTHITPDSTLDVRRSTELLQQGGAYVVPLPYDRHLAGGGAVVKDLLALETQEAVTGLGGAVMDRAAARRH